LKERDKGQGSPEQNNPNYQRNKNPNELGKNSHGFPILKPEQPPQSAGNNKPEIHPPKEIPLAQEPNLPGYEQQPDDLDSEVEEAIRRYGMTDHKNQHVLIMNRC
jgi:hypothetical protein